MSKRNSTENFIIKAKSVHGDRYDYSKVNYINLETNVTIICSKHGIFEQRPGHHLKGQGCKECSNSLKRYSTEEFIEKANKIHDNKYDYSKSIYINSKTKIVIICPHGIFKMSPPHHLRGQSCPSCNGQVKITNEKFAEISSKIHNNKYDYSLVKYKNQIQKVKILCPDHGEFET